MSAPAAPRPARSRIASASTGSVSHAACDRNPIASADTNAPSRMSRPDATAEAEDGDSPAAAAERWRTMAVRRMACAVSATARPAVSLIGRDAVIQNSGAIIVRAVATTGRPSHSPTRNGRSRSGGWARPPSSASSAAKSRSRANADSAPNSAPQNARARGSLRTQVRGLPEGHVDRIARRVRPMAAGIEVPQAEGEVDRIDVFERGREKRQVAGEEDERQNSRGPPGPGAPPDRREQVRHGGPHTGCRRTPSLRLPIL